MFPLCYKYGSNRSTECNHIESERCFIGTWVTEEVKTAIGLGYKIVEIFEIWHYEQKSQYDPQSQTGGLFSDYISTFQGYKQEASDWSEWVVDDKTQDDY